MSRGGQMPGTGDGHFPYAGDLCPGERTLPRYMIEMDLWT